jgi:hypothetical protein
MGENKLRVTKRNRVLLIVMKKKTLVSMLLIGKGFAQMKTFRLGIIKIFTCFQNTFDNGHS